MFSHTWIYFTRPPTLANEMPASPKLGCLIPNNRLYGPWSYEFIMTAENVPFNFDELIFTWSARCTNGTCTKMHQYSSNLEWADTLRQKEKRFLAFFTQNPGPSTNKKRASVSLYNLFNYFWLTSHLQPKEILAWLGLKADPEVVERARLLRARPSELMAQLLCARVSTQLRLKFRISIYPGDKIIRI